MKQVLIQLDTDSHASPFDAIAAYDADVDVVLGFAEVTADNLAEIVQGAMFPRGPDGLEHTAFWVGGSNVRDGEAVFGATQKLFFDPFSGGKFAHYFFRAHEHRTEAGATPDSAHQLIEEAQLFVEAAHQCYTRIAGALP